MSGQAAVRDGKYLYAVVAGAETRSYGPFGIEGNLVYTISNGGVAAVVSDFPAGKIRPERRHLAAHQQVLVQLMRETTPLPMAFGIIADGPKAVSKILSRNRGALLGQINRVAGKVEMGLRATWDVPNIFEYFVSSHPELRIARDEILCSDRGTSHEGKLEVGRMFDRLLNEDREAYSNQVEEILSRGGFETKRFKCRDEREVMRLACLVAREAQAEFEANVFEAAKLFNNSFAFDFNGPWAPHSFIEIDLDL